MEDKENKKKKTVALFTLRLEVSSISMKNKNGKNLKNKNR